MDSKSTSVVKILVSSLLTVQWPFVILQNLLVFAHKHMAVTYMPEIYLIFNSRILPACKRIR